ncbi:MAG: hypothetical protein U9R25_13630 [Chloroflexota bacterium]|nr:hypothetical protein [Chloroflexota bacterium]
MSFYNFRELRETPGNLSNCLATSCVYRVTVTLLVAMLLLQPIGPRETSASGPEEAPLPPEIIQSDSGIAIAARSGATIDFRVNNGKPIKGNSPKKLVLPYLVLYRNDQLSAPAERTLLVTVQDLSASPLTATIVLELETEHADPDAKNDTHRPIVVWQESREIANSDEVVTFVHRFDATTPSESLSITTPTDYYGLRISFFDHQAAEPSEIIEIDHAFLLENQWVAQLPKVREETPGAAPDALIINFCDMFPFQKDNWQPAGRLLRQDVPRYVATELVPAMIEAVRLQSNDWGFTWHEAWTSWRSGPDRENLSVALSDGETWFHGVAPARANSTISIRVTGGSNTSYDTLTDGIVAAFHHELFHSLQRSLHQALGGNGDINGLEDAWDFFIEGTAVMVTSVAQPEIEFSRSFGYRAYAARANAFLGGIGSSDSRLNTSYEELNPYQAALFWRFLYEKCGGMANGREDPGAGMAIIKNALAALFDGGTIDIATSAELVTQMKSVMDRALERTPSCPFSTFEDSQRQFSIALYTLRLDRGRCQQPGRSDGCELYDPNHLYKQPSTSKLVFTGEPLVFGRESQPIPAGIPNSFGMDFVEINLVPGITEHSLAIELSGEQTGAAVFDLQVLEIINTSGDTRDFATARAVQSAIKDGVRRHIVLSPAEETTGLALAITRVDNFEQLDAAGVYTLSVELVPAGA